MSDDEKDLVNQIFTSMNVKLYNISLSMLQSHYDAEEAVAQTFLKIMNHIERISDIPNTQIEPYCIIILKNEATNIIRKRKKSFAVEDIEYFEAQGGIYTIEEEYLKDLEEEKLKSFINYLSEEEKEFVHFRFFYEMSFREVAAAMDITEDAAKKRGQRVIKKLRSYYEKEASKIEKQRTDYQ